jgi:nitroreductase
VINPTIETILSRRSIRKYESRPVEEEKIELILKCGQFAPSRQNGQTWHFTVVTNRDVLNRISAKNREIFLKSPDEKFRKMAEDPNYDSFRGSPMAIIVSGEGGENNAMADCANAVENMTLAAHSLGLGSCYLVSFRTALLAADGKPFLVELGIPEGYVPLLGLALGYGCETLGERAPRRAGTINRVR